MSKQGQNIDKFIPYLYGCFFLLKAGLVLTSCILKIYVMVNLSLPRGKKNRVDLVDNRPSTNKEGDPK